VALWMENLKRKKERYYKDNLEVVLHMMPGYDKDILIEAVHICLDKGIYNGDSVKSLCEHVHRRRNKETETDRTDSCPPRQTGLIQSYNEIFHGYDKT
ncbi:putative transposase, partial [Bacteroides fragilis str. 3783N2-1]